MKSINIYSVSSSNLDNRTKYVCATLSKLKELAQECNLNVKIFSISSPSSNNVENNIEDYNKRVNYEQDEGDKCFNHLISVLNAQQISNIEKQRKALQLISEQDGDLNLILEDDVLISNEYISNIKELFESFANDELLDWDILLSCISCGNNNVGGKLNVQESRQYLTLLKNKSSYFIKPNTAKMLYDFFNVFKYTFKNGLSKFIATNDIRVFLVNKILFIEGSKIGIFPSSTNIENFLFQNNEYVEMSNIVRNDPSNISDDMIVRAETLYDTVKHLPGPDITYIMGILYYKTKQFSKAKQFMTDACHRLKKEKGLVSKSSIILNNAINICQYDQDILEDCKMRIPKYI